MEIKDFKKIARILKESYKKLEEESMAENIDIFSPEYKNLQDKIREKILKNFGFTLEEYQTVKNEVETARKTKLEEKDSQLKTVMEKVSAIIGAKGDKGDKGDIGDKGNKGDKGDTGIQGLIGPQGLKGDRGEKGLDGRDGRDGRDIDESTIGYLEEKIDSKIKSVKKEIPEPVDIEGLKEFFRDDFHENFKKNINIMGMPDFRKLAMGLQGQIDEIRNSSLTDLQTITTMGEVSDTACFPMFANAQTGNQQPKTNAGLKFNASTGLLESTLITSLTVTGSTALVSPILKPLADGTTALIITKADGSTPLINFDSTNSIAIFTAAIVAPAGTASYAGLRLQTGTPLSSVANGAVEWHGDHLYFSTSATRFKLDRQASNIRTYTWVIDTPATGGILGPRLAEGHTVTRIDSYTKDATSVTFNIEERATIGSAGVDILASDQVANVDGTAATSFYNADLASAAWLYLDISAISGTPGQVVVILTCTVEGT